MAEFPLMSAPYIYVCTRLRIRAASLLPAEVYQRMLGMGVPEITRFLGEHGYAAEIHEVAPRFSSVDLVDVALARNLAGSFQEVIRIAPGHLRTLTAWYLHRWDIVNVMSILRALRKGLSRQWIDSLVVPAGELDRAALARISAGKTVDGAIAELASWRPYPTLAREMAREPEKGRFARTENALYREYYADLLADLRTGLHGSSVLEEYIRTELDIANFRNLLRLRRAGAGCDCGAEMIPGGTIPVSDFGRAWEFTDADSFTRWFRGTRIFPLLVQALRTVRRDPLLGEADALAFIGDRWSHHQGPMHEVEMAVTHARLGRIERLAKLEPFSVLAILVYLERKKYEVFNLRAIAHGVDSGLPADEIRQYLVI